MMNALTRNTIADLYKRNKNILTRYIQEEFDFEYEEDRIYRDLKGLYSDGSKDNQEELTETLTEEKTDETVKDYRIKHLALQGFRKIPLNDKKL